MNCYAEYILKRRAELWEEYENTGCVASVEYFKTEHGYGNMYTDYVHGIEYAREYKTQAIAKREGTKFLNRVRF